MPLYPPPSGGSGIPASTVTTKGDLIVATGSAAVTRQAVGADGTVFVANSAQSTGVNWRALTAADIGAGTFPGAAYTFASATASQTNPTWGLTDGTFGGRVALASSNTNFSTAALAGDVVVRGDAAGNTQGVVLAAGPTSAGYLRVANTGATVGGNLAVSGTVTAATFSVTDAVRTTPGQLDLLHPAVGTRQWNDRLRFKAPSLVEVAPTIASPVWTTTGAPTVNQVLALMAGRTDNGTANMTTALPALRITWNQSGSAEFSQIQRLMLAFGFNSPTSSNINIIWESSVDGVTWTSRSNRTTAPVAMWVDFAVTDNGADPWFRLTLLCTMPASATTSLRAIMAFSSRPGDQGGGEQNNVPYIWDGSRNITLPATLSVTGSSSLSTLTVTAGNSATFLGSIQQTVSNASTASQFTISNTAANNAMNTAANFTNNTDSDFQVRLSGVGATDKYVLLGPSVANRLAFGTSGVERMSISTAGLLTVSGNGLFTGSTLTISPASGSAGIELGSTTSAATPFIDFHSSGGTEDYTARIIAAGGTAGTSGSGGLTLTAATVGVSNDLVLGLSTATVTGTVIPAASFGLSSDNFLLHTKAVAHYGLTGYAYDDGSGGGLGNNVALSGYFGLSFVTTGVERIRVNFNGNVVMGGGNLTIATSGAITSSSDITSAGVITGRSAGTTGHAFFIGNDLYLDDINVANTAALVGAQNSAIGALQFGLSGPTVSGTGTSLTVTGSVMTNNNFFVNNGTYIVSMNLAGSGGAYHSSAVAGDLVLRGEAVANTQGVMLAAGPSSAGYVRVAGSGVTAGGTLNSTGNLSENGNRVYSAGNAPPYPVTSVNTRTGAVTGLAEDSTVVHTTGNESIAGSKTFTGAVTVRSGSNGYLVGQLGDATHTGYTEFIAANGVRQGYIGFSNTTATNDAGTIPYIAATHAFTGALTTTGTITENGNRVFSAGNAPNASQIAAGAFTGAGFSFSSGFSTGGGFSAVGAISTITGLQSNYATAATSGTPAVGSGYLNFTTSYWTGAVAAQAVASLQATVVSFSAATTLTATAGTFATTGALTAAGLLTANSGITIPSGQPLTVGTKKTFSGVFALAATGNAAAVLGQFNSTAGSMALRIHLHLVTGTVQRTKTYEVVVDTATDATNTYYKLLPADQSTAQSTTSDVTLEIYRPSTATTTWQIWVRTSATFASTGGITWSAEAYGDTVVTYAATLSPATTANGTAVTTLHASNRLDTVAGRVGIGTDTPTVDLDVAGTINAQSSTGVVPLTIKARTVAAGGQTGNLLEFTDQSGNQWVSFDSAGNLGSLGQVSAQTLVAGAGVGTTGSLILNRVGTSLGGGASSGAPLMNGTIQRFRTAYWNGTTSVDEDVTLAAVRASTTAGDVDLTLASGRLKVATDITINDTAVGSYRSLPRGRQFTQIITANQATITTVVDVTGSSNTLTLVNGRRYRFIAMGMGCLSTVATDVYQVGISLGGVQYALGRGECGSTVQANDHFHVVAEVLCTSTTPTAPASIAPGSTVCKLTIARSTGTGTMTLTAATTAPTWFLCEDLGG